MFRRFVASSAACFVAVAAMATSSCSSPTDEPGAAFVGIYDAYATVEIRIMAGSMVVAMFSTTSSAPTQIFHGTMHDVVLDDGQCLLPGDIDPGNANHFTLHLPLTCSRAVQIPGMGGGTVALTFTSGEATITPQGALTFTAGGTFTFAPDPAMDGGVMGMAGQGTFQTTSHGSRQ